MSSQEILKSLEEVSSKISTLSNRIDRLELDASTRRASFQAYSSDHVSEEEGLQLGPGAGARSHQGPTDPDTSGDSVGPSTTAEVQRAYEIVKNSLNGVQLPQSLHVYDSKTGISKECQPSLNILSKCARYTETALKQLNQIVLKDKYDGDDDLKYLFTILQAEIGYLQSEYTALMVRSKFDDSTTNLFKCFERNQAAFTDQALGHLRCAAEISAISHRQPRGNRFPSFRGSRGRGRGFRPQSDSFHAFASRDIPARRWNGPPNQGGIASNQED
jgi:hypothetical protein